MSLFYRGKHRRPPRYRWGRISAIVLLMAALGTSLTLTLTNRSGGPSEPRPRATTSPTPVPTVPSLPDRPDVYYIVFEEYGGTASLREIFDFDNGPFLRNLEQQGMYVARDSTANYPRTLPSLVSSLNMIYLDRLAAQYGRNSDDLQALDEMIDDHEVGRRFRELGYRWIHMGSWWSKTRTSTAADENISWDSEDKLPPKLFGEPIAEPEGETNYRTAAYERILWQFHQLTKVSKRRGPTFTFAHILSPHGPYAFDRDGAYRNGAEAKDIGKPQAYIDQLVYTNKLITGLVKKLLDRPPDERPIVVIQSDEGPYEGNPSMWDRFHPALATRKFPILNAYYLPGVNTGLSPSITPVNTFRLVFNLYFGGHMRMLPDLNFIFRDAAHLYDLTEVTDEVRELVLAPPGEAPSPGPSPSPSETGPAASPSG